MRAADLDETIALQNAVDHGLTGGLHSLDPAEVAQWRDEVQVGDAYVNRAITGAVVQRQPFGGWKRSVIGPGAKAGGPPGWCSTTETSWRTLASSSVGGARAGRVDHPPPPRQPRRRFFSG